MRTLSSIALQYAWVDFRARVARARSGELERGASAVEWVVITMIAVGLVIGVGIVIATAVHTKSTTVGNCINGASSQSTTNGC